MSCLVCLFVCESTSGGGIWNWPRSGIHRYSTVVTTVVSTQVRKRPKLHHHHHHHHHQTRLQLIISKWGISCEAASSFSLPGTTETDSAGQVLGCWMQSTLPLAAGCFTPTGRGKGKREGGEEREIHGPLPPQSPASYYRSHVSHKRPFCFFFSGDANGWARRCRMTELYAKRLVPCGPSPAQSSGTMWIASIRI